MHIYDFICCTHEKLQVKVLPWPHVAYKLIRAKAILAILPPSIPHPLLSPLPSAPFLCQTLPLCIQQPGCFQPVWCQDSDFRISFYKPHLEQLAYFVYVCLLEGASLYDFLLSPLSLYHHSVFSEHHPGGLVLCFFVAFSPPFILHVFVYLVKPHLCTRQMRDMSANINDLPCNKHNQSRIYIQLRFMCS